MRLPSRASVRLSATSSADDFAQRQLAATLHDARASLPTPRTNVALPLNYVLFQGAATLFASIVIAGSAAANLDCLCWPARDGACSADLFKGVWLGLAGAAAVRGTEAWRIGGDESGGYNEEPSLSHSILCATAPLAVVSRVGSGDSSVGERAVSLVLEQPSTLPSAFLHVAGTTAAVAWSHGVVQQAVTLGMTDLAIKNAMANMPADPEATWWWPVVASGTAVAPIVAALLAASVTAAADGAVSRALRPQAMAEESASEQFVRTARERSLQRFALDAPADVAQRRDAAFQRAASEWEQANREREAKAATASFVRALVASAVYAASGNSQIAPILAGALGGSGRLVGVFLGKT